MGSSERYQQLIKALDLLRRHLLPDKLEQLEPEIYPLETYILVRAYLVLAHAEIESFLEERVEEVVRQANKIWKTDKKVSKPLLALVAFSGRQMEEPAPSLKPTKAAQQKEWDKKLSLTERINIATRAFYEVLKNNHGIKEENVLRLLLPIGVETDDLDPFWLTNMNDFGKKRGEMAHSSFYGTQYQTNPKNEYDNIALLLEGLEALDKILAIFLET
ncbi:MAG: HEPN domain-containing protein [Candidatus Parabeggiatoa sp.]|nr:HEPN domain-containing protein [Candidatus Parabeggiatoa sp.]